MYHRIRTISFKLLKKITSVLIPPEIVLGRTACLGQAVVHAKSSLLYRPSLINQQKVRCDLFLDWLNGAPRPDANEVKKYLNRDYVLPWIEEQQQLPWLRQRQDVELFVMDSFAELTDQKFTHKQLGWSFACHYNDLIHSPEFTQQFDCHGLLPLEEVETAFSKFFTWLFEHYPNATVLFIHFPTKFDSRSHFRERAIAIHQIMTQLATKIPSIKNISLPEERVQQDTSDSHPYHFAQQTVDEFAAAWEKNLN